LDWLSSTITETISNIIINILVIYESIFIIYIT